MNKGITIVVGVLTGALVFATTGAIAVSYIDRKQSRQIHHLKVKVARQGNRLTVLENAPDTTTGLADDVNNLKKRVDDIEARNSQQGDNINYLYGATSQLGGNGRYYGNVDRFQVILPTDDPCVNGQPRQTWWNNNHLSC